MATLISRANGNFTDAATWHVADAASLLDSQVGTTVTTAGYVDSAAFVLPAVQIGAIALKIASKSGNVGTCNVRLYNVTAAVDAKILVLDIVDLPSSGWAVILFGAVMTPNGTDSYAVGIRHNTGASLITLYRDAVAGNWSRMVRTTTTQAPAVNDRLVIAGNTGTPGLSTDVVVTLNNTATTIFGDNSTTIPSVTISRRGTLQLGTAAATNYYLKLNSSLIVYEGGTLNLGTSGTPLPVSSTAVLEFNSTTAGDFGLEVYGALNIWGASKRSWCLLTANIAAAATVLTVEDTTGWRVGDEVCIGSTSRTAAECEKRTILTVDSATQITLTAGVTYAHSGTSPTQAEVGNLTRNVKIRGISLALTGYIVCRAASQVMARCVETTGLGASGAGKAGITFETITGSGDWQQSALHEPVTSGTGYGLNFTGSTGSGTVVSNNVGYNLSHSIYVNAATSGTHTCQNNLFMRVATAEIVLIRDVGGTFTGNYIVGSAVVGLTIGEAATIGTMTGNVIHSCATNGLAMGVNGVYGMTSLSCTIWRCLTAGIAINGLASDLVFLNCTLFGNGSNIVYAAGIQGTGNVIFDTCTFSGDTTFASAYGLTGGSNTAFFCHIVSCTFGVVAGIRTAHTTADIGSAGAPLMCRITLWNTLLASATEVEGTSSTLFGFGTSYIKSANHDQVPGQLRNWYKFGRVESDTTLFATLSPSLRLTPSSATGKVSYTVCTAAIAAGTTAQVSVKVRKSVAGDGTAYNGNFPRIMLKRNEQIGVLSDTVLATATAASLGAWEVLTGTTPVATNNGKLEFFVDADGTTGWVNVDDVRTPPVVDTTGFLFGVDGEVGALPMGLASRIIGNIIIQGV